MIELARLITEIRAILDIPPENITDPYDNYLDLAKTGRIDKAGLEKYRGTPGFDPFLKINALLRRCVRLHYPEHLHAGINELLKSYLLLVGPRNQEYLTSRVWQSIEDLFRYCLETHYPFSVDFWNYLSKCIEPVIVCILDQSHKKAGKLVLKHIMQMGRMAVRAGLHTSKLQHTLRVAELKCQEKSLAELLAIAEDYRQNMEV